jgi:hypothetical protein
MARAFALISLILLSATAYGQGVLGDLLSGELVNPKVGAWAWYELKDSSSGKSFVIRMAIVDEEKVGTKTGHWFELEVVPMIGYRSVYKMLLTGPAKDPSNIQKMICREGLEQPQEIPVDAAQADPSSAKEPERKLIGTEQMKTSTGVAVQSEHYELATDGGKTDLWLNSDVRPMGLVKLKSAQGELMLRNYGIGGQDARSVIDEPPALGGQNDQMKVEVRVDKSGGAKGDGQKGEPAKPNAAPKPANAPKPATEPAKR